MWSKISAFIIKSRVALLAITACLTLILGYMGSKVQMTYEFVKVIPETDPEMKFYSKFNKTFGEDGNILAVGMQDKNLFRIQNFQQLCDLATELKKVKGVKEVVSLPTQFYLQKDEVAKKFTIENVFKRKPQTQAELDSLLKVASSWKIYEGLLYNPESKSTLLALTIDKKVLNSEDRSRLMDDILVVGNKFTDKTNIKVHYAGLPYVRAVMIREVKGEFNFFLYVSAGVTCLILLFFFRSGYLVLFTSMVIAILICWTTGCLVLFGYKITLLTGILPALIVIISIPNCVYMYNKYHQEIRKHGNKVKAITRIIRKIGFLTFMTNANTAVGFLVLMFTDINVIREFGIVAGIISIATFVITIVIIPVMLYFIPLPKPKHLKHLDLKYLRQINMLLEKIVIQKKWLVYGSTAVLLLVSLAGIFKIQTRSYMVDDLPKKSAVKEDLAFFEKNFTGVMPLEIVVDFHKPKGVYNPVNLRRLENFEDEVKKEEAIANPLSVVSFAKTAEQAYYNGDPEQYKLPGTRDFLFLRKYLKNQKDNRISSFLTDSSNSQARISCKVADIGSDRMTSLVERLESKGKEIFKDTKATIHFTGSSLLFLKGNDYLIKDLTSSLIMAFILISLMMAMIFANVRMILISLVPNLVPMILTAGIMGIFNIPLKPSTALIFSISFGISIDSTIHYLSKFKQELKLLNGDVRNAVLRSLEESGVSIIYSSLVLFGGFVIFVFSDFGGTVALGLLTSITLFFSMITNLTLLPMMVLHFYKPRRSDYMDAEVYHDNRKKKKKDIEAVTETIVVD